MFNLEDFIANEVTRRPVSMFNGDIENNKTVLREKISGKSVLVIGGAGSIGSSYVKAIVEFEPASLVIVDTNENALTELTRDLRSTKGVTVPPEYIPYPMDYSSPVFEKMFRHRGGFDIVANFSAHKHVRSEKDVYSIEAMLRNNVLNAEKLLKLLKEYPPQVYFCVSTDKAANPVNIMGASKRLMEDMIFAYSEYFPVVTARFANVAFSNGSLPAGFIERMAKKQPIGAPSDVKRYFVSPKESGQICMLASILGENRQIFFPKFREAQMLRFDEIAIAFLRAHGYEPVECGSDEAAIDFDTDQIESSRQYPVHFSASDTSGEKAYEEFYTDMEAYDLQRFDALGVILDKPVPERTALRRLFDSLEQLFGRDDFVKEDVVRELAAYLPNFNHIETGKSLDSKM